MNDEIAKIWIGAELDLKSVERDISKLENKKFTVSVEVDDEALTNLNKHLDLKVRHFKEVNQYFSSNPLTVKVDDSELDDLNESLSKVESRINKLQNKKISISSDVSGFEGAVGAAFDSLNKAMDESIKKLTDSITQPFKSIGTGLFEGIGISFGEQISKGLQNSLKSKLNFDLQNTVNQQADKLIDKIKNKTSTTKSTTTSTTSSGSTSSSKSQSSQPQQELKIPFSIPNTEKAPVAIDAEKLKSIKRLTVATIKKDFTTIVDEALNILATQSKNNTLSVGDAKREISTITEGFKKAYASLKQNLSEGNTRLAKQQAETIIEVSARANQQIEDIYKRLKSEGNKTGFGTEISTAVGSAKGLITRYVKPSQRVIAQIDQTNQSNQLHQAGKDTLAGVMKGLADVSPISRQGSIVALSFLESFKKTLGIQSPARKMILATWNAIQGVVVGTSQNIGQVTKAGASLAKSYLNSFQSSVGKFNPISFTNRRALVTNIQQNRNDFGSEQFFEGIYGDIYKQVVGQFKKTFGAKEGRSVAREAGGMAFSMGAFLDPVTTAAGMFGPLFQPLAPTAAVGALITQLFAPVIPAIQSAITTVTPIQSRLSQLAGSQQGGRQELSYLQGVGSEFNVSAASGSDAYSKLAFAAKGTKLEGEGVKELFEGISASLKSLNLSAGDSSLIFQAYTQILAKGKLSMEELRQQLGEKFPPAMQVFAKAMNVSVPELQQLITKGAVLSEDILPKVAKVLKEDFGKSIGGNNNFTSAVTRLENATFGLQIKLNDTFSGIFTTLTDGSAAAVNFLVGSFDKIAKLGGALLIGMSAQVAIGIQTIMSSPGIAEKVASVQNLFFVTLKKVSSSVMPFMVGSFIDVLDDFLGAKNSVFDNMAKGFTQLFTGIFDQVDNLARNFTGKGLFTVSFDEKQFGVIEKITSAFSSFFKSIPSGLIEMGALIMMFEQVYILGGMYVLPTLKNVGKGLWDMGRAFGSAVTNTKNLRDSFATVLPVTTNAIKKFTKDAILRFKALAFEIGSALAVMMFARSDFGNPIADSFNNASKKIVNNIKAIENSLNSLKDIGKTTGESLKKSLDLQSKGLELSIPYILGLSSDSLKSDDLIKRENQGPERSTNKFARLFRYARSLGTVGTKEKADSLGIGDFFTGKEASLTVSQQQLLKNAGDINKFVKDSQTQINRLNVSPDNIKFFSAVPENRKSIEEINKIDKEIKKLTDKRVNLGLINSTDAKKEIRVIDKEIDKLLTTRKSKSKVFDEVFTQLDDARKNTEELIKQIDNDDALPIAAKRALKKPLEEYKKQLDDTFKQIDTLGLSRLTKPLEDIWTNVVSRIRDAETAFEKFQNAVKVSSLNQQTAIITSGIATNASDATVSRSLATNNLQNVEQQRNAAQQMLTFRESALKQLLSVPNSDTNQERKKEIDALRDNIQKDRQSVAELSLQLAQGRANLQKEMRDLTKQVNDYYQQIYRNAQTTKLEVQRLNLQTSQTNASNRLRSVLSDGYDTIVGSIVDGLEQAMNAFNSVADKTIESQQQLLQSSFDLQDTNRAGAELLRQIPNELPAVKVDLDFSSIPSDNNVAVLREEVDKTIGGTETLGFNIEGITSEVQNMGKELDSNIQPITLQNTILDIINTVLGRNNDELVKASDLSNQWNSAIAPIQPQFDLINITLGTLASTFGGLISKTAEWIGSLVGVPDLLQKAQGFLGGLMGGNNQPNIIQQGLNALGFGNAGTTGAPISTGQYRVVDSTTGKLISGIQDVSIHHPSRGARGREAGRKYADIDGLLEEVTPTAYGNLIKRDFVISKNGNANVPVPAPVSGRVSAVNAAIGRVNISDDKGVLLGAILHLKDIAVKVGDVVQYGQKIGVQGGAGGYPTHVHAEAAKQQMDAYLKDLRDGVFDGGMGNQIAARGNQAQSNVSLNASAIAKRNNLQSLVVADTNGRIISQFAGSNNPASPASTIKLVLADVVTDRLNPNAAVNIKKSAVAEYEDKFKAGQSTNVATLLNSMLKDSNNTAFNSLVQALGGVQQANQLVKAKGYSGTSIGSLLSIPGGTGGRNTITAADATRAMTSILRGTGEADKLAENALRQTRNFGYSGEAGGKIGNNSKVIGNVGIVNINGSEYIVTAYANVDGNKVNNRKLITNATNEITRGLMSGVTTSSAQISNQVRQQTSGGISRGGNLLSQAELSRLTPLGQKLYQYQQNPKILAFSDVVARAEGTDFRGDSKNFGYTMMIGGKHVNDLSSHAFVNNQGQRSRPLVSFGGGLKSSAFGRYQMMDFNYSMTAAKRQNRNWDSDLSRIFKGDNPGSASPAVQDLYFIASLEKRGVLNKVLAGDFAGALRSEDLANHYASLQAGSRRSAHGQGTSEGQLKSTLPFAQQRLQARLREGMPVSVAANTFTSATNSQLQRSVNLGVDMASQSIQARSEAQQANIKAQSEAALLQAETALNRVRRNTDRFVKDQQETRLQNARQATDLNYEAIAFPTIDQRNLKESTDNFRKIDDNNRQLRNSIETHNQTIKQATELLEKSRVDLANASSQSQAEIANAGIKAAETTIRESTKSKAQAEQRLKENEDILKKLESSRIERANFEEYQRSAKVQLDIEKEVIGSLQEHISKLEKIKEINPFAEDVRKLPALREELALKQLSVDTETKLLEIEDTIKRSGSDPKVSQEQYKVLINFEKQIKTREENIRLTRQQQEEELRLMMIQRDIKVERRFTEIDSQFAENKVRKIERTNSRNNPFGFDTGELERSRAEFTRTQEMLTNIQLRDDIENAKQFAKEVGLTSEETTKLISNLEELNKSKLDQLHNELNDTLDADKINEFNKVIENTQTQFSLKQQPIINLRNAKADRYEQGGGNVFVANAMRRQSGRDQELFNRDQQLMQLDRDVLQARMKGIEITDAEVENLRTSIIDLSNINLDNLNNQFKTVGATLGDIAKNGISTFSQGLTDVITKGGSLSDVFDNLFNNVLNQALNMGINSLLGGLFGGLFYSGGVVGKQQNNIDLGTAFKREKQMSGKQPHLVVAHKGELFIPADRVAELNRQGVSTDQLLGKTFATGGIVGDSPREYGRSLTPRGGNNRLQIEYNSTQIAGQNYVTEEQFQEGIRKAAEEGGRRGASIVENKLSNSTNYRRSLGF